MLKTVNAISMNMQIKNNNSNNKIDGADVYKNKQEFDILLWYFDLMSFALQQTTNKRTTQKKIATTLQICKQFLVLKCVIIMKNREAEI